MTRCELCDGTGVRSATGEHFRDVSERALKRGGKVTITKDWSKLELAEPPIREEEAVAMGLELLSKKWEGEDDFSKGMRLMQKKIKEKVLKNTPRNRARCKKCGDVIESNSVHDFVRCKCGAIAVDGGLEYSRRLGNPEDIEEMP